MRLNYRERLTLTRRVVSLDMDSASIRLLMTRGNRVVRWASAPFSAGIVSDGVISDPPALGAEVRQLMKASGITGSRVIAAVSGLYTVSRILNLRRLPEESAEGEDLVLEEVKMLIPLSPEEQYLSWQALSSNEIEQQVLFIGMPKALVDAQVQALAAAGISPRVMELKALALVRAVNREQALVVNVEAGAVDIAVVADGSPQIMRTVAQQGDLSPEDRARQVRDILEHTVSFYNSHHRDNLVGTGTPLFLAGAMVENQSVREAIKAEAVYSIEPLVTSLECPPDLPIYQYAVNIGLALREIQ